MFSQSTTVAHGQLGQVALVLAPTKGEKQCFYYKTISYYAVMRNISLPVVFILYEMGNAL